VDIESTCFRAPVEEERGRLIEEAKLTWSLKTAVGQLHVLFSLKKESEAFALGLPIHVDRNSTWDLEELELLESPFFQDVELNRIFWVLIGRKLKAGDLFPIRAPAWPCVALRGEVGLAPEKERIVRE